MKMGRRTNGYAGGMNQAEVAAALGCTRGNVSMIEVKALRKLRRALERLGVDGPPAEPTGFPDYSDAEDLE